VSIEHVVSSDGTRIAFERVGRGRPVVALHGGLGSRDSWRQVADLLADDHQFFLVDRRGRGGSDRGGEPHSVEQEVGDARAALSVAGPGAVVVGHSYGGAVALELARTCADGEVGAVVAYEPAAGVGPRILEAAVERIDRLLAEGQSEDALRLGVEQLVSAGLVLPDPPRPGPLPASLVSLAWTIPRELRGAAALGSDMTRYASVRAPVLLMTGGRSAAPHHENAATIRAAIPHADVVEIEGQGHVAHNGAPDLVARAIAGFLAASESQLPPRITSGP
jgi:pimeloyl-ACP methyl ester carboxylesterase